MRNAWSRGDPTRNRGLNVFAELRPDLEKFYTCYALEGLLRERSETSRTPHVRMPFETASSRANSHSLYRMAITVRRRQVGLRIRLRNSGRMRNRLLQTTVWVVKMRGNLGPVVPSEIGKLYP